MLHWVFEADFWVTAAVVQGEGLGMIACEVWEPEFNVDVEFFK